MKINDIIQIGGLPFIVTSIETDYDPYLQYYKHFRAHCFITEQDIGGALTECVNPFCDIQAAISGAKPSKYV